MPKAEATCQLNDPVFGNGECSDLVIDGRDAAQNGYPDVTLKYTLKLCNYNEKDVIKLLSPPSTTQFFIPNAGSSEKEIVVDKSYNEQFLEAGNCTEEVVGTFRTTTSRAKYFMKSQLQGSQTSESPPFSPNGFCFAYSFHKVDFKYDYGLGNCSMNFSVSTYFGS